MGTKRLLRTINVSDSTSTFNDGNVDIITCVYDEDDDYISVFAKAFEDIESTEEGFSGEFYDKSYLSDVIEQTYTGLPANLSPTTGFAVGVHADADNIYTLLHYDADGVFPFTFETYLYTKDITDGTQTSVNLTADYSVNRGMYVDTSATRLYIAAANEVQAFNSSTGARVATEDTDTATMTDVRGIWIDETAQKLYVGDNAAQKIYVYDISTPTSPTRSASEDIDLSTANASITFTHWSFIKASDRVYVWDTQADAIRSFKISDSSHVSAEDQTLTHPGGGIGDGNFGAIFSCNSEIAMISGTSDTTASPYLMYRLSDGNYLDNLFTVDVGLTDQLFVDENYIHYVNFNESGTEANFSVSPTAFPTALVHKNQKDIFSSSIGVYWESYETGYGFTNGDNFVYFKPIPGPPYMLKKTVPLTDVDSNDITAPTNLTASIKNYTLPTGKRERDGSIILLAKGGTPPYTYQSVIYGGIGEDGQTIPTFSSLNPGNYFFRVKDANNVSFDLPKFSLPYRTTSFGNYGLVYTHRFTDKAGNITHQIEIFDRDSATSNTNIDGGSVPLSFSTESQGDDLYDIVIQPASLSFTIKSTALETYKDLAESDDERFGCVWSINDGGVYNERWRGYLLPESYSQDYGSDPIFVNLTFSDRLGDLSNIKYANRDQFNYNENFTGGEKSQLDVLLFCLKQLNFDMSGIRVAIDWFEANHASTSTDTPLEQTYVDTDSYLKRDKDTLLVTGSKSLKEVVKAILEPYSATLMTWKGYYYIIKQDLLLTGSSYSYVEFDMDGVQQNTGTETSYIDFGTASASNRWRWRGGRQSLTTTRIYRDVELMLKGEVIKESLTKDFIIYNINALPGSWVIQGYQFVRNDKLQSYFLKDNKEKSRLIDPREEDPSEKIRWTFFDFDLTPSTSKLVNVKDMSTKPGDRLSLKIEVNLSFFSRTKAELPEAFTQVQADWGQPLEFQLKIGNLYYQLNADTWTTSEATNRLFVYTLNQDEKIELDISAPDNAELTEQLNLTVFIPSFWDYDHTTTAELAAVDTTTTGLGFRQVLRTFFANIYAFTTFELVNDDFDTYDATNGDVYPDDYDVSTNPKFWKARIFYPIVPSIGTRTEFVGIDLHYLPNGESPKEEYLIHKAGNKNNKVTLQRELNHFDAPPGIKNPDKLYYNILKYDTIAGDYIDTEPTSAWNDGGNVRRIQDHRLDWLLRLSKQGRQRISGSVDYNTEISPIQVLRDPNRDNRRYFINGATWDLKNNKISGEFVEIGNDNSPNLISIDSSADTTEAE